MKRALILFSVLACFGALAQPAPMNSGPCRMDGADCVTTILPATIGGDTTTSDVAAASRSISGQSANSTNTVNTAGAPLNLAGGLGRRFFTIVSNAALATKTITLTANGTLVTLTASAGAPAANQFGPVGSDDTAPQILVTSTALAAAISAQATLGPLMTPSVVAGVVYLTKQPTLNTLVIATGTAGALVTATAGADGVIVVPVGSVTAPSIRSDLDASGLFFPVSGVVGAVGIAGGGNSLLGMFNNAYMGIQIPWGLPLSFGAGDIYPTSNPDLWLSRRGAASLALGRGDIAAPVAQSFGVQGVIAGTADTAGQPFTIQGSVSTGSGSGGALKTQTTFPGAASTVQNAVSDRSFVGSGWTTLTESTPTAFATLTFGASRPVAALLLVTIEANDGTDYQSMSYYVQVNSVRKATGNTVTTVAVIGTPPAVASTSATTLTAAFTATDGAAASTINCDAVSSLAQTTLRATFQLIANGAGLTVAPVGF